MNSLRPGSPTLQPAVADGEDDVLELFMPQRKGRVVAPWRRRLVLLALLLTLVAAGFVAVDLSLCFAWNNAACYFYIEAFGESMPNHSKATSATDMFRLLLTVIWLVSFLVTLATYKLLVGKLKVWRRSWRLRHRVVSAMSGSSSRADVQRKLMRGMI